MKHGPVVLVFFFDHGRRILLGCFRRFRSRGQPGTLRDPLMVKLPRLRDGKSTLGYARAKSFVDDSEIQRHGDRRGLIRTRVVKLAVHHDRNGNDPRLALVRNLHQSQRTRSFVGLVASVLLRKGLRVKRLSSHPQADETNGTRQNNGEDDDAQPHAI